MPLRKLWNSIRGQASGDSNVGKPKQTAANSAVSHAPANSHTANSRTGGDPKTAQQPVRATVPFSEAASKTKRSAASRDDKKLFRRIESMSAKSILEVKIGDGNRALAMLQTLTHKGHSTPLHYIAIDEFEMGGGDLSLRTFHKQLREYPAKAHLVPMPTDAGLDRVVRTFGQVDLIIWSSETPPTAEQSATLARLSKPETILFTQQDGRWSESQRSLTTARRAA